VLTPEELARNEQLGALFRNRAAGGVPRRMPDAEIEQLIQAAAIIGGGRAEGLEDGETIQRFVRQLVNENDRRGGGVTQRANQAESALKAAGLAPDDLEAKNMQEILQDEANFGFAYEEDAQLAEDGGAKRYREDGLRKGIRKARNMREGKKRDALIAKLGGKLDDQQEDQKFFDFGLRPIVNEDEDPVDVRERGRLVNRGGKVAFEQGGGKLQVPVDRDTAGRAQYPAPNEVRMNPDFPVGMENDEMQRLNEQDRAMGQSAVREFERYERGDLTPTEMERRARLDAIKANNEVFVRDGRGGFEATPARAPINEPSADEAKAAILGQLQSRKEANRAGRRERIMAANDEDAGLEAVILGNEARMRGKAAAEGQPNIAVLGQLKGDKLKRDMGLQLGDQRASVGDAIRVEMPDGSFRFVDAAGRDLAAPVQNTQQSINIAEGLNAPQGANNAVDFVVKNQFEDRGAQFFGDESVLAQMNDKGAGGGIEQVDIGGALRGIEQKVAARLGIDPKRIGGVKGFQAAMNAVIDDERRRGNALIRLEDGKKVRVDNPGVEEALLALKVQPAEARQIANALKQQELAEFGRFDPRVEVDSAVRPGLSPENVILGVNDPKRGGDRVDIAKDVRFQGKVQAAGIEGDAAKPFIGRVQGEPAFGGFNNVLARDGRAMDPVDVRLAQEERVRQNRKKKVANMAKKGKKIKFGIEDDRADVAKIRQMQEGNVFAQIRADRAQAQAENALRNERGVIRQGRGANVPGDFVEPRGGYKKVIPGVKRVGEQELLPRPVRPDAPPNPNPRVESAGGFGNVEVPADFKPATERRAETVKRRQDFRDRAYNRIARRDAGVISGAVLASVLGLSAMGDDEEQEAV
jgi:hypothetical protein